MTCQRHGQAAEAGGVPGEKKEAPLGIGRPGLAQTRWRGPLPTHLPAHTRVFGLRGYSRGRQDSRPAPKTPGAAVHTLLQ